MVVIYKSCLTLCDPMNYTVHGILQTRILEWVAFLFSKGYSQPRSPVLWAVASSAEPPRKPKNTGVGNLSLLQRIFLTQELNQGLLHCRQILYQLSYQRSPVSIIPYLKQRLFIYLWYISLNRPSCLKAVFFFTLIGYSYILFIDLMPKIYYFIFHLSLYCTFHIVILYIVFHINFPQIFLFWTQRLFKSQNILFEI